MSYKWYVVHVYSGSEKRVKETIEEQMKSKNMEEFIEDILVPTEEILEIRKGAKVKTEKKFFPGYLLIKMNMTDESWHFVKSQPKVSDGPFQSFNGLVEEIDEDKSRLKVSVSIFGRATPVDLEFTQVEKI
jgi:transcriptional antiterminator NusG